MALRFRIYCTVPGIFQISDRAVDTHSFFADPDPAVLLNADPDLVFFYADPDPAFKKM